MGKSWFIYYSFFTSSRQDLGADRYFCRVLNKIIKIYMIGYLNFGVQLTDISSQSIWGFRLYQKWTKDFSEPYVTKTLYTSFVRPALTYGSVIWNPHYGIFSIKLNQIRDNFYCSPLDIVIAIGTLIFHAMLTDLG